MIRAIVSNIRLKRYIKGNAAKRESIYTGEVHRKSGAGEQCSTINVSQRGETNQTTKKLTVAQCGINIERNQQYIHASNHNFRSAQQAASKFTDSGVTGIFTVDRFR